MGLAAHNRISTWRYFVNKLLRSLLKAGVYFLEQSDRNTAAMAEQVKDRVQNLSRRARHAIYGQEDHTVRNAISFAAGIGLGIGVGMLLAPSPGEETRSSIVGNRHRGNVSYQPIRGARYWPARSIQSDPGRNNAVHVAGSAPTFSGSPSEQSSTTERDRKRRHSPGCSWLPPRPIPGPHQSSNDGESGPKRNPQPAFTSKQ